MAVPEPALAFEAALDECRETLGVHAETATVIQRPSATSASRQRRCANRYWRITAEWRRSLIQADTYGPPTVARVPLITPRFVDVTPTRVGDHQRSSAKCNSTSPGSTESASRSLLSCGVTQKLNPVARPV